MHKYLIIFSLSWQNEFIYRLNFILWRFRNILRFLMTYFLWSGIFLSNRSVFGYNQSQMLTYVFLLLIVATFVWSAPSADNIGSEIASGDLSNYLLKPINYLTFWFTRDISSKALNLAFAIVEITILGIILKPEVQFPADFIQLLGFIISCFLAMMIFFLINISTRFYSFWAPENTWGLAFVILVIIDILAGSYFPLDVLPYNLQIALQFTPFPYLLYYPISIFLGKVTGLTILRILLQSTVWLLIMYFVSKFIWHAGLKVYSASGR